MRRGVYYFVDSQGNWISLGGEYGAALRHYAELIGQQHAGNLGALFDRYLAEIIPGKAPRTQRDQQKQLELLRSAFGHLAPAELSAKLIIRYRNARGQKSQTQTNQELALLSHICTMAVEWEVMEHNPCRDVRKFRLKPRGHYIEDEDYRQMYKAAGKRLRVLMDLALLTGQREGDLLALRWQNVTDEGLKFAQGKTGKVLIVTWSAELRKVIARARQITPQGECVVSTQHGAPYSIDGFQSLWRRAKARAALARPFHFHDLRAKSASDDALTASSERLGHADSRITQRVYMRAPRRVKPLNIGHTAKYWTDASRGTRKNKIKTA